MVKETIEGVLISSAVEGTVRTVSGNGKNIVENTADVIFEKGDKAIDDFFNPLIKIGQGFDRLFSR